MLLILSLGVAGAQEENDQAQLRVVHAAPDAGDADVYLDGELAIEGLGYTDATDFQAFDEGEYQIQVTAAGDDVENAVFDTTVDITGGDMTTIVVYGTGDDLDHFTYDHDWDDPENDQARIVLVNATSDEVDVELRYDDESFGDGLLTFGNVHDETLDAGDYNFEVVVDDETVTTIDGFSVMGGQTFSIFVMGTDGNYEAVTYEDMAALQPVDPTPETTPDVDETPEATPETTPEATPDTTPEATPDTTPEATPATPETTPEATPEGTPPALPETGAGGAAGEGGTSGWIALAIAAFAIALGGGLIWRTRNERTAA